MREDGKTIVKFVCTLDAVEDGRDKGGSEECFQQKVRYVGLRAMFRVFKF